MLANSAPRLWSPTRADRGVVRMAVGSRLSSVDGTRTQELHVSAIAVVPYEGVQLCALLASLMVADAMVFVRPIGAFPSVTSTMGAWSSK